MKEKMQGNKKKIDIYFGKLIESRHVNFKKYIHKIRWNPIDSKNAYFSDCTNDSKNINQIQINQMAVLYLVMTWVFFWFHHHCLLATCSGTASPV